MQKGVIAVIVIVAVIVVVGAFVLFSGNPSTTGNTIYGSSGSSSTGATVNTNAGTMQTVVMTDNKGFGYILEGSNGYTLYEFQGDTNGQSNCYGTCATTWPPLTVDSGIIPQGQGITANLGTTTRTDGTMQVTANGMPLYYYSKDVNPGSTNGQGVLGKWYVVSSDGQVVMSTQ